MCVVKLTLFCLALFASVQSRELDLSQVHHELQTVISELQTYKQTAVRLEEEIRRLQVTVNRLERTLSENGLNPADSNHWNEADKMSKSLIARTCMEINLSQPDAKPDMYWIDPDGPGVGETPIYVFCDMTVGLTKVEFDAKPNTTVTGCSGPGCFIKTVNYYAEMNQIKALIGISSECHQSISYSCIESPLHYASQPYSWWLDRDGNAQYYWSKNDSTNPTCDCGVNQNCINPLLLCNCDALATNQQMDTGLITNKDDLPITGVMFGLRASAGAIGFYTLGPLECSGRNVVNGMPSSCRDLWVIGHTLNGFYSVMVTETIQTVYCDFNKMAEGNAMQTVIGSNDVKSTPVYFYVQRSTSFTANGTVPFDVERMNIGDGMDYESGVFTAPKAGIYFFNFDGMKRIDNSTLKLHLYLNDDLVETTYAPVSNVYQHFSLSSNLRLQLGDQVKLVLGSGGLYDNESHYGGFIGMLLQEELSAD